MTVQSTKSYLPNPRRTVYKLISPPYSSASEKECQLLPLANNQKLTFVFTSDHPLPTLRLSCILSPHSRQASDYMCWHKPRDIHGWALKILPWDFKQNFTYRHIFSKWNTACNSQHIQRHPQACSCSWAVSSVANTTYLVSLRQAKTDLSLPDPTTVLVNSENHSTKHFFTPQGIYVIISPAFILFFNY